MEKRTCDHGHVRSKDAWERNEDCCPACDSPNYTGRSLFSRSGRIVVSDESSSQAKAPETFADFEDMEAHRQEVISSLSEDSMLQCANCDSAYTLKQWRQNHMRCPNPVCGARGKWNVYTPAKTIAEEVEGKHGYGKKNPPIQSMHPQSEEEQWETIDEEYSKKQPLGTKYWLGRAAILAGIVLLVILLISVFNRIPVPSAAEQVSVPVLTEVSPIATEVTSSEAITPQYEQVVTTREMFQQIIAVKTPWSAIKTVLIVLYGIAFLFALLDRIMSNQWYDAIVAVTAAILSQFGSASFFNPIAELVTKIPDVHIGIVASHWVWALVVEIICTGSVIWVSVTGTRDWTPMALYFGLLAGGSMFFGHLGVVQTLFLIPSGVALPVIGSKWETNGDIVVSLLTFFLLVLANAYALKEALKPYRGKEVSVSSIAILALSVIAYFPLRIFCKDVPILDTPIGIIVVIFVFNFLIAFFLRERFDRKFGNTTAEYKMGLGKAMSPFDVVLSLALIAIFMIQLVGKV